MAFEDVLLDDFSQESDSEGLAFFIVAADRNRLAAIPLHGSDAFVKLDENEIIADDGVEFPSGKVRSFTLVRRFGRRWMTGRLSQSPRWLAITVKV